MDASKVCGGAELCSGRRRLEKGLVDSVGRAQAIIPGSKELLAVAFQPAFDVIISPSFMISTSDTRKYA